MFSSRFKFLLDENVRTELFEFLQRESVDVERATRGVKNGALAALSLQRGRVVVTNDHDLTQFHTRDIHGVVWLRIPQNDSEALVRVFSNLLASDQDLEGGLVVLYPEKWDVFPLPLEIRTR